MSESEQKSNEHSEAEKTFTHTNEIVSEDALTSQDPDEEADELPPDLVLNHKLFGEKKRRRRTSEDEKKECITKLEYLELRLREEIKKFRFAESKNGRKALLFRTLSTALAAIMTVLLGINTTEALETFTMLGMHISWYLNTTALLISAFLTVIGEFKAFYDTNELWVKSTYTANRCEQLIGTIEYLKLGIDFVDLEDINLVKLEYDAIQSDNFNYLVHVREADLSSNNKKS